MAIVEPDNAVRFLITGDNAMKSVQVTGVGTTAIVDVETPQIGPADVLVKMRACGI